MLLRDEVQLAIQIHCANSSKDHEGSLLFVEHLKLFQGKSGCQIKKAYQDVSTTVQPAQSHINVYVVCNITEEGSSQSLEEEKKRDEKISQAEQLLLLLNLDDVRFH